MKLKLILIILSICLQATEIFSQAGNAKAKQTLKYEEAKIAEEKKKEEEAKKKDDEQKLIQKYYAKLKNPPGFYEGAFLVSFMGGTTLAPTGSYISHEKVYDERVQQKIGTGSVNQGVYPSGTQGVYFQPSYNPGIASQFDFEYGWKDKIGLGFTIMQNSIEVVRQDVIPGVPAGFKEYVDPAPRKRTLYKGNSMQFLATFHPLPKTFFDPYLAFRGGVVGFTGEAHAGIDSNRFAFSNQVNNGIGGIMGLAGGLNIYFGRYSGLKTEVGYYSEYLKADQFSTRTLNSYQAMIGVFLNFSNIQSRLEEP
jgi:hypothetical protein